MILKVIPKVFGVEVQSLKNPNHCVLRGYLHKHFLEQNIFGDGGGLTGHYMPCGVYCTACKKVLHLYLVIFRKKYND